MDLLIRLIAGVAMVWLVQALLGALGVKEPANRIIFVVAIVLVVLWIIGAPMLR